MEALTKDARPILLMWADDDMVLPLDSTDRQMEQTFAISEPLHVIEGAGHFLPVDRGAVIGETIADWLGRTE